MATDPALGGVAAAVVALIYYVFRRRRQQSGEKAAEKPAEETEKEEDPDTPDEDETSEKPDKELRIREEPPFTHGSPEDHQKLITITSSKALQNRVGEAPAPMMARQIHFALTMADLPHRVVVTDESGTVVPPAEGTVGSGAPAWWKNNGADKISAVGDANLLLVDQVGGGGTFNEWATVGAGGIHRNGMATEVRADPAGASLFAGLHELAHCFQVDHDYDQDEPGYQHTGIGWNGSDKRWHLHPMNYDHGVMNACGEEIPKREYDKTAYHLTFTDCTVKYLRRDMIGGEK
jgi:hypothetical protein